MGNIKEVTVHYGRKINLGNYSSADIEVELVIDVNPGENPDTVIDEAFGFAKAKVKAIVLPLIKENPSAKSS